MTNPTRYNLEDGALVVSTSGTYVTYTDLSLAIQDARALYIGQIQDLRQEVIELQAKLDVYEG